MKKQSTNYKIQIITAGCFLFFVFCLLPFASAKAPEGTPTRAIQDLDDKLDDYKTGTALTPEDREFNRNLKREILYGTFDIRELSQLALSKHWNERTPQEQDYFVHVLTDLLENRAILSKEQGQKKAKTENIYTITYKGDKYLNAEKTRVLTRTSVYVKSEDIRVELDYKLKKVDNIWRAYDVIVDNASLLDNYKYQFDSIIKKNGYPDLIKRMENKLTSLKNKSAK